jgi:hypothetical protein
VRRGRKAADLIREKMAELPKEERGMLGFLFPCMNRHFGLGGDEMNPLLRIFFIIFLLFSSAQARVKYIPIENLPAMADFIVIGTVIDSTSRWNDKGIMIFTDYTIEVEEDILSNVPPTIKMSFAGGTVGAKSIIVTHTPLLKIGEKYLLFGYDHANYSVPVVGHEQGIFRVVQDRIKQAAFIVDYNGYQLEMTREGEVVRGPLAEIDSQGALVQRQVEKRAKRVVPSRRPVVRNPAGQEIPQDESVFEKPRVKERGSPLTRSGFIDFIRTLRERGEKR